MIASFDLLLDGGSIIIASSDKTERPCDARVGRPHTILKGHEILVVGAKFSPDGDSIVNAPKTVPQESGMHAQARSVLTNGPRQQCEFFT